MAGSCCSYSGLNGQNRDIDVIHLLSDIISSKGSSSILSESDSKEYGEVV